MDKPGEPIHCLLVTHPRRTAGIHPPASGSSRPLPDLAFGRQDLGACRQI
jgi:hypothetical protein